ncbi:hypothetical protein PF005_g33044 [Phytophthora fragariae]|uniref:Secreted protein n=1 Tax=Phytophthora fragariae TaxID=53985 RepID=A0A6A3VA56_9STRA|nr:hypothetical protein PF003_g10563 [Phytophthora fragariae]KAE8916814.1 hypothetical protein PF009_g32863 [Phytophthora fragariae]KAE8953262.1 hypothetical protein PF011_g32464 [Phytophthora fragariae]KAE9054106.1 hypothetical protein PF010_g32674 [Phytophthora fragariae]KAE9054861.1 hypothetical protein PF007_g32505 [Phytophthora fragariae]
MYGEALKWLTVCFALSPSSAVLFSRTSSIKCVGALNTSFAAAFVCRRACAVKHQGQPHFMKARKSCMRTTTQTVTNLDDTATQVSPPAGAQQKRSSKASLATRGLLSVTSAGASAKGSKLRARQREQCSVVEQPSAWGTVNPTAIFLIATRMYH